MPHTPFDAKKAALAFLRSKFVAVVATSTPDGQPQAATVFYWVNDTDAADAPFKLYFVTRRSTRKFPNLLANNRVAVVVGTEFEPATVQIDGEAEIIDASDGIGNLQELKKLLVRHPTMAMLYAGEFFPRSPFRKLSKDFVLVRVRPTWVRFMHHDKANKDIEYDETLTPFAPV
jgi:uncharacterized pyridoxamine 5'-phosphate oxidase family protein